MEQEPQEMLGRDEQKRLVTALRVALMRCQEMGIDGKLWRDMLYPANLGLVPENLGMMKNLLKAMIGYDPLEGDTVQPTKLLLLLVKVQPRQLASRPGSTLDC